MMPTGLMMVPFATPKISGGRYISGPLPLPVLPEVYGFGVLVQKLAREFYLSDNPQRKKTPKNYYDRCKLRLSYSKSNVAIITRDVDSDFQRNLFPEFEPLKQNVDEFTKSRDILISVLSNSRNNLDIPKNFPLDYIRYFSHLGKKIGKGEILEISDPENFNHAIYDKLTIKNLLKTYAEEYSKESVIEGIIYALDRQKNHFGIRTKDGELIQSKFSIEWDQKLAKAFQDYSETVVEIDGIVSYNKSHSIIGFSKIKNIESRISSKIIPSVKSQLSDFAEMKEGWMNGEGEPVKADSLEFATSFFERLIAFHGIQTPYLYPTLQAGIQAEWTFDKWELSIEFDFTKNFALLHALKIDDHKEKVLDISIGDHSLEYKTANFIQSVEKLSKMNI